MLSDLRFAFRQLAKSPGFTAVAVLSLALGIGAGTAVFSVINAVMLRSLPVPNPHELRDVGWASREQHIQSWDGGPSVAPPTFFALRDQAANHANIFAFSTLENVIARGHLDAFPAKGMIVSDNFFAGVGIRPVIGRSLAPGEDYIGTGASVVISYDWWEKHFARDTSVLGQTIVLNNAPFTIVGVAPRGFAGVQPGFPCEFYVPLAAQSPFLYRPGLNDMAHWFLRLMARVKPTTTDAQLKAVLDTAFAREVGSTLVEPQTLVHPGRNGTTYVRDAYGRSLFLMLGMVGLVVLVACANVTGLSLARRAARQHELAVRAALGAQRWRLIRQSLTESLVLAFLGGSLGIVLSVWGRTLIARFLASEAGDLHYDFSLDHRVLAFALTTALVTALLSGLLPALRASRVDPLNGLKTSGALNAPRLRIGRTLVAVQICLSLLLLTTAGLYVRTLVNLARIDAGFSTEKLLLVQLNIRGSSSANAQPALFYGRVQDALAAIPGVQSATFLEFPLLGQGSSSAGVRIQGRPSTSSLERGSTRRLTVGETFFTTMGVPLSLGRNFSPADGDAAAKVIIVNESFVREFLPNENPIGLSLNMWETDWQIIGVCHDIKYRNLKEAPPPTTYFPFRQRFYSRFRLTHLRSPYFAVRTTLDPLTVMPVVRKALASIDRDVAVTDITTQDMVRDRGIGQERLFATLCGALAGIALLLSCVGLYGLMAYHVTRRTSEIGIRVALGAEPRDIAWPVIREALLLACVGIGTGLPAAIALTGLIKNQLYGVQPNDPLTLALVPLALMTATLLAAWLPASHAARIDPIIALRTE